MPSNTPGTGRSRLRLRCISPRSGLPCERGRDASFEGGSAARAYFVTSIVCGAAFRRVAHLLGDEHCRAGEPDRRQDRLVADWRGGGNSGGRIGVSDAAIEEGA